MCRHAGAAASDPGRAGGRAGASTASPLPDVDDLRHPLLQPTAAQADLVGPAPLVLDLSNLDFMSSAGLALLVTHHEQCAKRGSRLWVVTGENRRVLRPVQISGLDTVLDLVTAVADAVPKDPADR